MGTYTYISQDGDTIDHTCSYDERPDTIEQNGTTYTYSFAATHANTPGGHSPAGWPLVSKAAGFIDQPGEMERHVAADRANGVHCNYVRRKGCVSRVFDSPGQQRRWEKANGLINDS